MRVEEEVTAPDVAPPRESRLMRWVVHPYFFAAYPLVALYAANVKVRPIQPFVIPLIVVLALAAAAVLALRALLRDTKRSGLIVSVLVFALFAYVPAYAALKGKTVGSFAYGRDLVLMPAWLVLTLAVILYAVRGKRGLGPTTAVLNLISFFSVGLAIWAAVGYTMREYHPDPPITSDAPYADLISSTKGGRDIYYLVPDRYPGAKTLRDEFAYDNDSAFLNPLRERGFFIADQSHSNYTSTSYGLATSLNMEYLDFLGELVGPRSTDKKPMLSIVRQHRVGRILQSNGYRYHHLGSFWQPAEANRFADVSHRYAWGNEIWRIMVKRTYLFHIYRHTGWLENIVDTHPTVYRATNRQFDTLKKIRDDKAPTFTFAHILVPHDPYVFDTDGRFVSRKEQERTPWAKKFTNHLTYGNKRLIEVIDHLLDVPDDEKPIIIVQSDEGPYPPGLVGRGWKNATDQQLLFKFRILTAYHFPGVDTSTLPPTISQVNTFRALFNLYFGSDLEILDDRSFYPRRTYDFVDITRRLRRADRAEAASGPT